ncbi:helix-turn-helix domain-containing protein [Myceligenerans xiligouense]|uniref:AlpA family transcriptional regulator n=1 Tax=Myceligenerans xiligouense TaxID=253184 RepID=A0A3N4YKU3_9MICO|nr:helix-turn-helix domain-containing protein [Myceligenerans xiligouense]RPF21719.1 AlpA family transcriptional regulator [Myceligenerans xiligouense]
MESQYKPDQSRFMTLTDVCKTLDVSSAIVYGLLRSGELPGIQVGPKKVWRIERSRFEEYIAAQYAQVRERIQRGEVE